MKLASHPSSKHKDRRRTLFYFSKVFIMVKAVKRATPVKTIKITDKVTLAGIPSFGLNDPNLYICMNFPPNLKSHDFRPRLRTNPIRTDPSPPPSGVEGHRQRLYPSPRSSRQKTLYLRVVDRSTLHGVSVKLDGNVLQ